MSVSNVSDQICLKQSPVSLTNKDVSLCVSNVLNIASRYLTANKMGNPIALSVVNFVSGLAVSANESDSFIKYFSNVQVIAPAFALAIAKGLMYQKMIREPTLSPLFLVLTAAETYPIVQRAFAELSKCWNLPNSTKEEHGLSIAKSVFVHSINASCSIYRTWNTFNFCAEYVLSRFPEGSSWSFFGRGQGLRGTSTEQKMEEIIKMSKDFSSVELASKICPEGSGVHSAKNECSKKLLLEMHPDKVSPSLNGKATEVTAILTNAFKRSKSDKKELDHFVSDFQSILKADKIDRSAYFEKNHLKFVADPISALPTLYSKIRGEAVKYPYQIKEMINKEIAALVLRVDDAVAHVSKFSARCSLQEKDCPKIEAQVEECDALLDIGKKYLDNPVCTDQLFERADACKALSSSSPTKNDDKIDCDLYEQTIEYADETKRTLGIFKEILKRKFGC